MSTIEERFEAMQPAFDQAARCILTQWETENFAEVKLEPGDATLYHFIIGNRGRSYDSVVDGDMQTGYAEDRYYMVTLTMGTSYPWAGQHIHWDYAHKWVPDGRHNEWTQRVVCALLNAIADELKEEA